MPRSPAALYDLKSLTALSGIEQRLDAEHGAIPASSFEVVRFRAGLNAEKLVFEPAVNVLARQRVQGEAAVREPRQLFRDQTGNDEPVGDVDAELVAAEAPGRVAAKRVVSPSLAFPPNAFSKPAT